jgi:ArsR family transcriptional regulator
LESFAAVSRALGNANRLELLEHLAQGERSVELLAQRTGLSVANVSQHLQHLRRGGLVSARRKGKHVIYCLAEGPVVSALSALRAIAERNMAEVREVVRSYFDDPDAMETVSRAELVRRLRDGTAMLLDVRPEDEYRVGHLPGAVNMTLSALRVRMANLPKDREIVAYCRGPYCVLAFEAVKMLRRRGYNVRRLADGFPEWKAAGLAVETA